MATIKQVADRAGVSIGTVSHVITGSVRVSEALRHKVLSAVRELDYHPNHVARSLKTSRTRTLGIIVPDLTITFFPQVIAGAEAAAREKGYSLIAVNSSESSERQTELLSLFRSQKAEGILLVSAAGESPGPQIARLTEADVPVVCLDRVPEDVSVDSVAVDDVIAAFTGASHLIDRGYRRIAIVTGPLKLGNERRRLDGYRAALSAVGIEPDPELIWEGSMRSSDVTLLCGKRLLQMSRRPDALFCTNGPTALGALRALRDARLETPRDVGFVTFDELTVEDVFTPAITTIVQPAWEIGHRAAELLLRRIGERAAEPSAIRLPARLKVRESSRGPATSASLPGA